MTSRRPVLKTWLFGSTLLALATVGIAAAQPAYPPVTQARLDNAGHSKGWLMFNRSYAGDDYAPFTQITPQNVGTLKEVWSSSKVDIPNGFEDIPVVNGDYMFVTTPLDHIMAFNAKTGKLLWKYDYHVPKVALKTVCCDVNNRGVALYGDMVFMGTLDNHVLAFDAKTGKLLWNVSLEKPGIGYSISGAPLAIDGKVIIGSGGGEYGARGFLAGLDAKTGKVLWKTYTIPSPSEPGGKTWPVGAYKHGGGSPWMPGTYAPSTHELYWGVGNPGPWLATMRPGHNLYSDSVIAMDPDTGKIKWHYQYTRNDTWDYDGVNTPQLINLKYDGKTYKAIVEANRNGYFYAINREDGHLIYAKPFVHDLSILGIDKTGHAINNPKVRPALDKQIFTCPSFLGGKNWWPGAVDPKTNMAYEPTLHACMTMKGVPVSYAAGLPYLGETFQMKPDPASPNELGSIQAIDLSTGKQVWQRKTKEPWDGGAMATAGGLVFSGTTNGKLYAFDAKTGKILWTSPDLGSGIIATPISYEIDGRQYVAIWTGWGGVWPLWSGKLGTSLANTPRGGQLHVFALNG
ncbi:methanol/ethanol family PQQ-dependent dehydrogenase [Acidiphilium sp. AL]|uniref:Methanol/ethanol family PQQ-dependent dehydrogenase n=1 Tax=Acidiphilium iwatense TaxID=768198 RepID=A0ABS9E133_9PROT|nr:MULTISPECIES: methanol/ethanol family PQQ-dependent dehydrogenase [Acidiphilium]MCF3948706.1 methanol/ethanol family PQQ-dependent dehydrogenase [Acidiphilium iwatense]MCU4161367.1 methanol/ethanol family PQQ-dependent dehydrogenase [Acidiphilium sp. AL]